MQTPKAFLPCSIFLSFLGACNKSDAPPIVPATDGYTVYIAGQAGSKAVYWKDGVKVEVEDNANAYCMAVAGNDIYVGGYQYNVSGDRAIYWKNGNPVQIETEGISHVFGIAVKDDDVYCAGDHLGPIGSGGDTAMYWKNGIPNVLSSVSPGTARSIYIYGPTLYVVGHVGGMSDSAVVWKNGIQSWYGIPGDMDAMGVSSVDTFFVGRSGNTPYYWRTHSATKLAENGFAASIAFSGSDIYVGGGTNDSAGNHAGYWKNDVFIPLTPADKDCAVEGIAIAGSDVYAVGYYFNGRNRVAACWKNGDLIELAPNGEARAVVVVKK